LRFVAFCASCSAAKARHEDARPADGGRGKRGQHLLGFGRVTPAVEQAAVVSAQARFLPESVTAESRMRGAII